MFALKRSIFSAQFICPSVEAFLFLKVQNLIGYRLEEPTINCFSFKTLECEGRAHQTIINGQHMDQFELFEIDGNKPKDWLELTKLHN